MNEDEIRRLVKIVEDSNIGELEIRKWGRTIKISKTSPAASSQMGACGPQNNVVPSPSQDSQGAKSQIESPAPEKTSGGPGIEIKSPMVGTFYRSPAPDASPYVDINQDVKKGQVLCIIEAMKLMNEIESDMAGKIVEILVENGQPVEYNQPLFRIEPA